ncbi:MAG TPA: hypothetical protein ACFCUC_13980 [Desulfobacterales bacterium]
MSIRLLARNLYGLIREAEQLERALKTAPDDQKSELQDRLRKIKAERERLRRALEGRKDH